MTSLRWRKAADPRYHRALLRMGLKHGADWDCMGENCTVCQPYRAIERAKWGDMSMQERAEQHFGAFRCP